MNGNANPVQCGIDQGCGFTFTGSPAGWGIPKGYRNTYFGTELHHYKTKQSVTNAFSGNSPHSALYLEVCLKESDQCGNSSSNHVRILHLIYDGHRNTFGQQCF